MSNLRSVPPPPEDQPAGREAPSTVAPDAGVPPPASPAVLSQFRGSLAFMGGPPREGTIYLLDNGWARFVSDDEKTVTLLRRDAVQTNVQILSDGVD